MTKEEALDAIWMRCRHNDKTYEAYCVLTRELGLIELGGRDRVKPELEQELNELEPSEWEHDHEVLKAYDNGFDDGLEQGLKIGEPCTDCVSRKYLVEKAVSWDKHFADGIRYVALTDILNAPSVTPAEDPLSGEDDTYDKGYQDGYECGAMPRIGRWINNQNGTYTCDSCGCKHSRSRYCPNCGAKMSEEV